MPYRNAPTIYFHTSLCTGVDPSAPLSEKQEEIHAWRMVNVWGTCQDPDKPWYRYFGNTGGWWNRQLPVLQNDPPRLRRAVVPAPRLVEASEPCEPGWGLCWWDEPQRCAPRHPRRVERGRTHLLRSLALLAADAEGIYTDSGLDSDLAVARIFRAAAVALATGDHPARLQKMADAARLLLEADPWRSHHVTCSGFETLEAETDGEHCAQPYGAGFHIPSRDFLLSGRKGRTTVARRLLAAALEWPIFWRDRGYEVRLGRETLAQYIARKTTEALCEALRPNPRDPRGVDPSTHLPPAPSWSTDLPLRIQSELAAHFGNMPREGWATEANGRAVVLLFLAALDVPWDPDRKNFFSFLDKKAESDPQEETPDGSDQTSERRPRTRPPEEG